MNKKFLCLLTILLTVSLDGISQQAWKNISISSAFSFNRYTGNIQNTLPGFQVRLGYSFGRNYIAIAFEQGFKSAADSMWSNPKDKLGWRWSYKLMTNRTSVTYNYYVMDKAKPFNIYLLGGMTYASPEVVDAKYTRFFQGKQNTNGGYIGPTTKSPTNTVLGADYTQYQSRVVTADVGLGIMYRLGRFSLFNEFRTSLPLVSETLEGNIDIPLPAGSSIPAEARCHFQVTDNFPMAFSLICGLKFDLARQDREVNANE